MRITVFGGGGFFGRLVLAELAAEGHYQLLSAGRSVPDVGLPCTTVQLDATAAGLDHRLAEHAPDLVINCAGPFEEEWYAVVEAALACGSHYLDLADRRSYVLGIRRFDATARRAGLTVLSGVSSVPALSSAVVAAHRPEFLQVSAIDIGISASERVPGPGAVISVLGQCGQALPAGPTGHRPRAAAWTDRFSVDLPRPVGVRVMASCDVPDLELLPAWIPGLSRVTFRAGVASAWVMRGLRTFARLRQRGWIRRPRAWAAPMAAAARLLYPFGNGASGMFVRLSGTSLRGEALVVCWQLVARDCQGVRVAARGVVAAAQRLRTQSLASGARPCCMELTVQEYLGDLPVMTRVARLTGEAARQDELRWCSV